MADRRDEDDEAVFGKDVWVYCASHMGPHVTGSCTVPVQDKTRLDATTYADAQEECKRRGFKLYRHG